MENSKVFEYKGGLYPDIIRRGNANKYIEPVAKEFCVGKGLDIGGIGDWVFPGAEPVNVLIDDGFHAGNIPPGPHDYIFSSHTLEHLPCYVDALAYWVKNLRAGGTLFLYLPHRDMEYWLPQNNRKHLHCFDAEHIADVLETAGLRDVLWSGRDMYWSFTVVGVKA